MKENINALDEINKGATMGMDAIDCIIDKVENEQFKKVIEKQYNEYKEISNNVNSIYDKYNKTDEPHETNKMEKLMTWYGINMRTMMDKSDSKIAELLLQGTNMGIIEGKKILNNKELDKEVTKILYNYVDMQEEIVEQLKEFL